MAFALLENTPSSWVSPLLPPWRLSHSCLCSFLTSSSQRTESSQSAADVGRIVSGFNSNQMNWDKTVMPVGANGFKGPLPVCVCVDSYLYIDTNCVCVWVCVCVFGLMNAGTHTGSRAPHLPPDPLCCTRSACVEGGRGREWQKSTDWCGRNKRPKLQEF